MLLKGGGGFDYTPHVSRYFDCLPVSCIMWQSDLAACGHVGVATRAGGVLFVTRRDTCVRARSGNSQSNVIN